MVSYYKILHVLLKWLVDEDMASSRLLRLPATRLEAKIPGTLNGGQVLKMVRATSESTGRVMQARDAAITLLLADCGLRASELCNLTLDQLREDHVLVLGKGNKWREVGPLSSRTQRALRAYLTTWRPKQKPTCDNLFVCRGGDAFTRNSLGKLITRFIRHAC